MPRTNATQEATSLQEYWALQADPVLLGAGVPHGNGEAVLLIPGLFANDIYMATARSWLTRIGYRPIASEILWNVGCPRRLIDSLSSLVANRLGAETFSIIGHSRGGLLASALTSRFSDRVNNLIVVGSPLGGMLAAGKSGLEAFAASMQQDNEPNGRQFVFNAGRAVTRLLDPECNSPACECAYTEDLFATLPGNIAVTSIYSTNDPIVPPHSSILKGATNIAVEGSHSGLMFNRTVYPHVAQALSA